jgi:hypothetical protein
MQVPALTGLYLKSFLLPIGFVLVCFLSILNDLLRENLKLGLTLFLALITCMVFFAILENDQTEFRTRNLCFVVLFATFTSSVISMCFEGKAYTRTLEFEVNFILWIESMTVLFSDSGLILPEFKALAIIIAPSVFLVFNFYLYILRSLEVRPKMKEQDVEKRRLLK